MTLFDDEPCGPKNTCAFEYDCPFYAGCVDADILADWYADQ